MCLGELRALRPVHRRATHHLEVTRRVLRPRPMRASAEQVVLRTPHERGDARAVVGGDVALEAAQPDRGLARVLRAHEVGGGGRLVGDRDDRRVQLAARRRPGARASPRSGARPAMPIATSHCPWRQARPKESVITTAGWPGRRARSARADASGSTGSRISESGSEALDASTPAFAHTKPWRVRQMSRPASARTSSAVSDRIDLDVARVLAVLGGERERPARPGVTSASRTIRPSAFETTLCAIASTSPARSSTPVARRSARQVVARPDLGQAREREQLDQATAASSSSARVRAAPPGHAASARRSAARSSGVSTSSPSERTSATFSPAPAARRERGVARERALAERRLHHVRRRQQQRVRALAVAVGDDHDASPCASSALTSRGSSAGQSPGTSSTRSAPRSSAASIPRSAAADWPASTGSWTTRAPPLARVGGDRPPR